MNREYTFYDIELGDQISYRSSGGMMKEGRVIRKKQELIRTRHQRELDFYVEVVRVSILVVTKGAYKQPRVNLTQFKNIRTVVDKFGVSR